MMDTDDRDRYLLSVHLVVKATSRDWAQTIVGTLLRDPPIEKVTYIGLPIMLKDDDKPQAVEVHKDLPTPTFSLRRYFEVGEAREDAMRIEAMENEDYRAAVEQYDEDSINPNEEDMGTTKRD